jgi:hypothetical protein
MNAFRFDGLRRTVDQAIADGHAARRSIEQPRRAETKAEAQMLSAQREARVRDVLSALPQRITSAVALAAELPVRCLVMYVQPGEYEGAVYHDPYARAAKPEADPGNLRGAAAWVFAELLLAGLAPSLQHEYTYVAEDAYTQPTELDQLCICISVQ